MLSTALMVFGMCGAQPSVAYADIYRRIGADGVVHFTNIRPKGGGWSRIIHIRGTKPTAGQRPIVASAAAPMASVPSGGYSYERWDSYVREAAALYRVPVPLVRAVMRVESGFNPNVVSHVGAMGLMQLMPGTAKRMGVRNPFDPRENIFGGVRYLRILANMFHGDIVLTLAGYNAGEHAVTKYRGIPPYEETQRYVRNVLRNYQNFKSLDAGQVGSQAVASNVP
jgi:soluble lytic murein transglycosylase-like protein